MRKKYLKAFAVFLFMLCVAAAWVATVGRKESAEKKDPPLVTANFVNLDAVEKISKFRSCQGHTVVPQDGSESRRNMKHYVVLKDAFTGKDVSVTAPFDGYVQGTYFNLEKGLEGEIWIGAEGNPWAISFEHIILAKEFREGEKVKAGEVLGHVPDRGFDVVYAVGADEVRNIDGWDSPFSALDSVFNHMSDQVFQEYQSRGIASREDMVYSKEFRDSNPCQYMTGANVQAGQLNDVDHPEDWVVIR